MAPSRIDSIVVTEDGEFAPNFGTIAMLALRNRLPSIGAKEYAEAGGLIGYGAVPPKLRYSFPHVWHKENAKDTNDNIELGPSELQIEHVANAKFEILEAPMLGFSTRKRKQILCKVHTEHRSMRSNGLRRRNCRGSTAAAHIKDTRSGANA